MSLAEDVLARVAAAEIRTDPFPHIYVEDVFPVDFYRQLLEWSPLYRSLAEARGVRGYPQRSVAPAHPRLIWLQGHKAAKAFAEKLGVEPGAGDVMAVRDFSGYTLGPHTDSPRKILSALFYLPAVPGSWSGTSLYRPIDQGYTDPIGLHHPREKFKLVWTAPAAPNSMLAFARTNTSFHGVEPHTAGVAREIVQYNVWSRRG